MTGAFRDIRVLDLAVAPPGALAAMHLGEYGAEVTRVERGAHDSALWRYANRTKHVVPVRDGLVEELAANADVVIVDLPASELEAAGLTCGQLRSHNPSLIHAWMPPHAPSGETADLPYDELLLWAWTGLAAQQPGATSDHPVASVVPIVTYEQGALGACAIGAALVDRATRGTVHACTVSGLHAVNAMNTSIRIEFPGIFRPFGANKSGVGASPQFRMYRCRDGVWLFVCALTPSFFFKLLEALDQMDIMLIPEVDGEFAKFVTPPVQAIANEKFAARMAEFDSDHWAARFDEFGVPYAPVQTRAEWARQRDRCRQRSVGAGPGRRRHCRSGHAGGVVAHAGIADGVDRDCEHGASGRERRERGGVARSTACSSSTPPSSSPARSAAWCCRTSVRGW